MRRTSAKNKSLKSIFFKKIIALAVLAGVGWYIYPKEINHKIKLVQEDIIDKLLIRNIFVKGNERLSEDEIKRIVNLRTPAAVGEIDINLIRQKLEKQPYIESASVRLKIPGTLEVVINERKPYSIWILDKKILLIDQHGNILRDSVDIEEYKEFPIIIGKGANKGLENILQNLQKNDLISKIQSMEFIGQRRWNLNFADGMIVKLPEQDVAEAIISLKSILSADGNARELEMIDLRLIPEKIYIKP